MTIRRIPRTEIHRRNPQLAKPSHISPPIFCANLTPSRRNQPAYHRQIQPRPRPRHNIINLILHPFRQIQHRQHVGQSLLLSTVRGKPEIHKQPRLVRNRVGGHPGFAMHNIQALVIPAAVDKHLLRIICRNIADNWREGMHRILPQPRTGRMRPHPMRRHPQPNRPLASCLNNRPRRLPQ